MDGTAQLPPKPDVALALLQSTMSVYVHLDPRGDDVKVPAWFKKQPQLVLQVGLNMAVPIPDLDVGQGALSCTLSFNRRPEFCRIPWDAIYGLVGDDGRGMIWPESIPPEVASARDARSKESKPPRGHLRLAHSDRAPADDEADEDAAPGAAALDVAPPGVTNPQSVESHSSKPDRSQETRANSNAAPRPSVGPSTRPSAVPPSVAPKAPFKRPSIVPPLASPEEPRQESALSSEAAEESRGGKGGSDRGRSGGARSDSARPESARPESTTPESGGASERRLPPYLRIVK